MWEKEIDRDTREADKVEKSSSMTWKLFKQTQSTRTQFFLFLLLLEALN